MKQVLKIIAVVVVIISLVVFVFTFLQVRQEEASMLDDLRYRTTLLADSFKESIRPSYLSNNTSSLQPLLDKFAGHERLLGLAVYNDKGDVFAVSNGLPPDLAIDATIPEQAMDSDSVEGDFFTTERSGKVYILATPLHQEENVIGALVVFQRVNYINETLNHIWETNLLRLLIQALLFSIAILLIFRWIIFRPLLRLLESIRQTQAGKALDDTDAVKNNGVFHPIAAEISKLSKNLMQARTAASEEARLRLEKEETPWTEERLKEFMKIYLKGRNIFVVSNREPYIHMKIKNKADYTVPASGMVTALDPIMKACGGLWMAYGSGDADKDTVDKNDKLMVPPDEPKYTLKRIWLTKQEVQGYYNGFCNEALWPLCHMAHTRPIFRKEDWATYRKVNGKFAQALLAEIKNIHRPVILVQDYHFALLPEMIKKSRPDAEVSLFWHIPWPHAESFSICPWRKELITGMLGADLIGFHTQQHCNNFLDTVSREIESLVDLEKFAITHKRHTAYIKPFPISVAFTNDENDPDDSKSRLLEDLGLTSKYLGLGVDRLDYTKGILEKFRGIEFFLEMYPSFIGQFSFIQIASPSREEVARYQKFNHKITAEAERINNKFATDNWTPIVLLKKHYSHEEIYQLYKASNFCLITSLSDGMNLVAKEFVTARTDESGVLILSQFTGVARELKDALIINPYSAEQTAEAINMALTMQPVEQHQRMRKMREKIKNYNIYRWAAEFIKAVTSIN